MKTRIIDVAPRPTGYNTILLDVDEQGIALCTFNRPAVHNALNLDMVRESLEEGLGIAFEGPKGAHFFRSTLVQTLYYGLFSAWVLWCRHTPDPEERKGFSAARKPGWSRLPILSWGSQTTN